MEENKLILSLLTSQLSKLLGQYNFDSNNDKIIFYYPVADCLDQHIMRLLIQGARDYLEPLVKTIFVSPMVDDEFIGVYRLENTSEGFISKRIVYGDSIYSLYRVVSDALKEKEVYGEKAFEAFIRKITKPSFDKLGSVIRPGARIQVDTGVKLGDTCYLQIYYSTDFFYPVTGKPEMVFLFTKHKYDSSNQKDSVPFEVIGPPDVELKISLTQEYFN